MIQMKVSSLIYNKIIQMVKIMHPSQTRFFGASAISFSEKLSENINYAIL